MKNPLISSSSSSSSSIYIYIYIYQKIGILNLQLEVPKSSSLPQLTPSIFGILW